MRDKAKKLTVDDVLTVFTEIEEKSTKILPTALQFYTSIIIVARAYDTTVEEIEKLDAEKFEEMIEEVEKVNADFFTKMETRLERMAKDRMRNRMKNRKS